MKQFLKMLIASTLGTSLAIFFMFFVLVGMISAIGFASRDNWQVSDEFSTEEILRIEIDGPLVDRVEKLDFFESAFSEAPPAIGLFEVTQTLKDAAQNEKIKGLFIHIHHLASGAANIESLRREIGKFKDAGKFVIVFADNYTEKSYLLASVADEVALYPRGYFEWDGIHSTQSFYKKALDKWDVVPEIFRAGKYKSAVEPFINEQMSEASREQSRALIKAMWTRFAKVAVERTKNDGDEVERWASEVEVMFAQEALEKGLVNYLASYEEVEAKLMELTGATEEPGFYDWQNYYHDKVKDRKKQLQDKIAVVFAEGEIVSGYSGRGVISSREFTKIFQEIAKDKEIKGVVLRVNSPGGSALASDVIWTSTQFVKDKKPIVASLGNVAASGGYYMVAGSSHIMAEETTITGSIGVFGVNFMLKDFWDDNLGVTFDTEKSHPMADKETTTRPLTGAEKVKMQAMVDRIYGDFLNVVTQGRSQLQTIEQANEIAQGRVWAAADAQPLGLIDSYGGLEEAILKTAELAGLQKYSLVTFPREKNPFAELLASFGSVSTRLIQGILPANMFKFLQQLEPKPRLIDKIYTRMPYDIEIE